MELTNEIRAKVFGLYLGCEVYDSYNDKTGKLIGVDLKKGIEVEHNTIWSLAIHEVKLLLTLLENITDADAIEAVMISTNEREWLDPISKKTAARYIKHIQEPTYMYDYNVRQYLISKGYAVPLFFGYNHPLNGKTAIEVGIAIERTPTVQPRDKEQEQTAYAPFFNPLTGDQIGVVRNTSQTDDPATIYGDGTGYALPPIESHPIDEQQHHNHEHTTK